jgi:hypothetical protein
MLEILQIPVDCCGEMNDLSKVMSRLNYLLNVEKARSAFEAPTVSTSSADCTPCVIL